MTTSVRKASMGSLLKREAASGSFTDAQQLLDRRAPLDHLPQAVLLQVAHAALDRLLLDGVEVGVLAHHVADAVGDDEQFEDAGAAEVAGAAAILADLFLLPVLAVGL